MTLPNGSYVVRAIRRSSLVASTMDAEPKIGDLLGATATFADSFSWIDDSRCDAWSAKEIRNELEALRDPILSDLAIEKLAPPAHEVFAFSQTYEIYCGDNDLQPAARLVRIDDRVLVTMSPSGSFYLLLEKPLAEDEVRRLQQQLKSMKFYEGEITGQLDEQTRAAVAGYADYRGAEYRFKDAVITENLLDGLNVLAVE